MQEWKRLCEKKRVQRERERDENDAPVANWICDSCMTFA